ncbi:site-specific integrase [Polymorphobacter megasporae]|uniref:site-specific integrase n=1 Tax=Glacieibacterium megasporae TaxID=2835787 RepID=UPI001C1E40F9|nr:site-specific integrase [Polymorphobacter megasporae]UAJ09251.1 hypothetical protein KTC28_13045 [Polymorphobacter megasporae]
MCNYLSKPGSTYYFRRLVPTDLRAKLDRVEWSYSLRTKDRTEAKRLAQAEAVRTNGLIDAARAELAGDLVPSPTHPPSLARTPDHGPSRRAVKALAYFDREADEQDMRREDREPAKLELERRFANSNSASLSALEKVARDLIRDHRYRADIADDQRRVASYELQELKASLPPFVEAEDRTNGTLLPLIIERWFAERKVTAKTRDAGVAAVRWFYEAVGPVAVEQITRKDMLAFKDWLLAKGTTIANTKMKLSRISGLLGYALDNDIIQANYAKDIKLINLQAGKSKRLVYNSELLAKLFGGPVHAEGQRPTQGRGDASYWLPLLALYTGARLEELGQLRPGDVREQPYLDGEDNPHTTWVISITEDEEDGLHLKNAGSIRIVPVHPALIELGFIEFAQAASAKKRARIFDDLTPDKYGSYTAKWGMWFTTYRKGLGLTDRRLVFHSFRHTFKDNARHSRIDEGVQRQLMGHTGEDVADDYGSGHSLHRLVEGIALYRVPGFKLPPPAISGKQWPLSPQLLPLT